MGRCKKNILAETAQKMKFSNKVFVSKCDRIRSFLENLVFCAVYAAEKNADFDRLSLASTNHIF